MKKELPLYRARKLCAQNRRPQESKAVNQAIQLLGEVEDVIYRREGMTIKEAVLIKKINKLLR